MPLYVRGLTLDLDEPEECVIEQAANRLRVPVGDIRQWAIVRKSLDARRHRPLQFIYNLELALAGSIKRESNLVRQLSRADVVILEPAAPLNLQPGGEPMADRPLIVGFGPAGMFAGLLLAEFGYQPLIIERGAEVAVRNRDITSEFYKHRHFNPESNLLFGEGGAGTYSDGKLYTRLNNPRIQYILETLYHHGADPNILIDGKPHVGSDKLPAICRSIRQQIIRLGGEVCFNTRLEEVVIGDNILSGVITNGRQQHCGPLLLAIGHSARDTLRMLVRHGVAAAPKPFQVGVRIEHPQAMVDRWQYGPHCGHPKLPPAEYHLVAKGAAGEKRDVFSFCMCPGGMILPAGESPDVIVTNGSSRSQRDGPWANSALVLTINPGDLNSSDSADPLAGLAFQQRIEQVAFKATGESYQVPAQRACDFINEKTSDGKLETSYPLGGQWANIRQIIPRFIAEALARGIEQLDRRLPGFGGPEALITAPETRASSSVRITRDQQTRESISTHNLYPIGEGAGYAGGIISAAVDGIKTAEQIINKYAPAK